MTELMATVAAIAPGSEAKFRIQRQGQVSDVTVKIAERPAIATRR
jgi:S1-C subfamily serine protease